MIIYLDSGEKRVEFGTFGMRPSSRLVRRKDFERAKSKSMRYITEIIEYTPKADDKEVKR